MSDSSSTTPRRGPGELAELLADRHVAVVSARREVRERIAHEMAVRLAVRPATVVVHMADAAAGTGPAERDGALSADGGAGDPPLVETMPARQDGVADPPGDRPVEAAGRPRRHRTAWRHLDDGRSGVLEQALETVALLARSGRPGWRILIWHDADEAMRAAPRAFEQVLELLLATTVEHEYLEAGDLVLQRLVLLGGPELAAAVADPEGPFRRWSPHAVSSSRAAPEGDPRSGGAAGDPVPGTALDPRVLELEHPRFELVHA